MMETDWKYFLYNLFASVSYMTFAVILVGEFTFFRSLGRGDRWWLLR